MKRKRFTEEQIIGVLREQEAGAKVADPCRRQGDLGRDVLQLESQVRRHGCVGGEAIEGRSRTRMFRLKEASGRADAGAAALREFLVKKEGRAHCGQACADCADCVDLSASAKPFAHLQATRGLSERPGLHDHRRRSHHDPLPDPGGLPSWN